MRVADDLPERCHYQDEGCRAYPSCLKCPLPRCIYDEPVPVRHPERCQQEQEIARLYRSGVPALELAHRYKISERTVYRILRRRRR